MGGWGQGGRVRVGSCGLWASGRLRAWLGLGLGSPRAHLPHTIVCESCGFRPISRCVVCSRWQGCNSPTDKMRDTFKLAAPI